MESIFNQERAIAAYAFEVEIKTYIETLKEFGVTLEDTTQKVMSRFGLTKDVAENEVRTYWI